MISVDTLVSISTCGRARTQRVKVDSRAVIQSLVRPPFSNLTATPASGGTRTKGVRWTDQLHKEAVQREL